MHVNMNVQHVVPVGNCLLLHHAVLWKLM